MPSLYRKNKLWHMLTCPALHDSPVQHVIRNWNKTCWWIESWGKGIEFDIIEVLESSLSIRYISLDLALSISWLIAFRLPLKYCPIVTICHVIDFVLFDTKCYSVATKSWFPAFPWIKKIPVELFFHWRPNSSHSCMSTFPARPQEPLGEEKTRKHRLHHIYWQRSLLSRFVWTA